MVEDKKEEKGPRIVGVKKKEIKNKKPPRKVLAYYNPENKMAGMDKIKEMLLEVRNKTGKD